MSIIPHRVEVLHPGYHDKPVLLSFMATDYDDGKPCGVRYSTVYAASAIIAGNRFDGQLSVHPKPPLAVWPPIRDNKHTRLLPFGKYYFHVRVDALPWEPRPSPIVSDFRDWSFPHQDVPWPWRAAHISATPSLFSSPKAPKDRDFSCRITGDVFARERARIVPNGEIDWFLWNDMRRYCLDDGVDGESVMDHRDNIIMFRADVHKLWHNMDIGIIPKAYDQHQWQWRVRINCAEGYPEMTSLQKEFQNREVRLLRGICREFLFARFAMNAFRMVRGFTQRDARHLLGSMKDNKVWWTTPNPAHRSWIEGNNRRCFCTFDHDMLPGVVGSSMLSTTNGKMDADGKRAKAMTTVIGSTSSSQSLQWYSALLQRLCHQKRASVKRDESQDSMRLREEGRDEESLGTEAKEEGEPDGEDDEVDDHKQHDDGEEDAEWEEDPDYREDAGREEIADHGDDTDHGDDAEHDKDRNGKGDGDGDEDDHREEGDDGEEDADYELDDEYEVHEEVEEVEEEGVEEEAEVDDREEYEYGDCTLGDQDSNSREVHYGHPDPCGARRRHEECVLNDRGICMTKRRRG